jgi:hypothetical protein
MSSGSFVAFWAVLPSSPTQTHPRCRQIMQHALPHVFFFFCIMNKHVASSHERYTLQSCSGTELPAGSDLPAVR